MEAFKPITTNPYIVGNPVKSKEMFFGREDDFKNIQNWIIYDGGPQVILLIGGPRSGKTSILWQILGGRLRQAGEAVLCDFHKILPKIKQDEDLPFEVGKAILENPTFKPFEADFLREDNTSWTIRLEQLVRNCLNLIKPLKLIILCDEFVEIEDRLKKRELSPNALLWIKELLNLPVHFVMTSSREFEESTVRAALSSVAQTYHIYELSRQDAVALIQNPIGEQLTYKEDVSEKIYRLSGGHPFYVQYICHTLVSHVNAELKRNYVIAEDLEGVIDFIMRNPAGHIQETWKSLSKPDYAPKYVRDTLAALANSIRHPEEYVSTSNIFKTVLEKRFNVDKPTLYKRLSWFIQNTRLLEKEKQSENYRFRHDLLRHWISYDFPAGEYIEPLAGEDELVPPDPGPEINKYLFGIMGIGGIVAVTTFMVLFLNSPPTPEIDVLDKIRDRGFLRVGLEPDVPPMFFVDTTGQKEGFDYQLALLVAKKLGIPQIEAVEDDHSDLPDLLYDGKTDIIMGGYTRDTEIKNVVWSNGYLDSGLCLVVRQGSSIRELPQLSDHKIGISDNQETENWIKENISNPNIFKYKGISWFKRLDNDTVDAIVHDCPYSDEKLKAFPYLTIVKRNLHTFEYAIGVPNDHGKLLPAIDEAVTEIKKSAQYARLIRKFIEKPITPISEFDFLVCAREADKTWRRLFLVKSSGEKELLFKELKKFYQLNPSMSRNKKLLVFQRDLGKKAKICLVNLETRTIIDCKHPGIAPSISPDGKKIVYLLNSRTKSLEIMSLNDFQTESIPIVLSHNEVARIEKPAFLSDSKSIVFLGTETTSNHREVVLYDPSRSGEDKFKFLTNYAEKMVFLKPATNSNALLFAFSHVPKESTLLIMRDFRKGEIEKIQCDIMAKFPVFSRNEKKVYFISGNGVKYIETGDTLKCDAKQYIGGLDLIKMIDLIPIQ